MATPFNVISRDAQDALTEFSTAFDAAYTLADFPEWAKMLGLSVPGKYKTTFPVPVSAAGFRQRQGEDKFRDLFEKSLSVVPFEWQDGVRAHHLKIEAPDFIDWAGEPERIALEAKRLPNTLIAAMLEANPVLEFDGLTLFNDAHPVAPIGAASSAVIDNNLTGLTALTTAALETIENQFNGFKGPNGKPSGRRLTTLLVPRSMNITAQKVVRGDLMYNSALAVGTNTNQVSPNVWSGIEVIVSDELTASNVFYAIDKTGPKPWVVADPGAPEEIVFDKSSDLYKTSGYLAQSYIKIVGYAAALPYSIIKCAL